MLTTGLPVHPEQQFRAGGNLLYPLYWQGHDREKGCFLSGLPVADRRDSEERAHRGFSFWDSSSSDAEANPCIPAGPAAALPCQQVLSFPLPRSAGLALDASPVSWKGWVWIDWLLGSCLSQTGVVLFAFQEKMIQLLWRTMKRIYFSSDIKLLFFWPAREGGKLLFGSGKTLVKQYLLIFP